MQEQGDQNPQHRPNLADLLACPACRGKLETVRSELCCLECGARWPIRAGIPCFLPDGQISDYGLARQMGELNELAVREGWYAAAIQKARLDRRPDYALEYITSEARADFRFILPMNESSVVLDIGSGWGNISTAFARSCRLVYALDTTIENLRFVQIRAQQEQLPNVIPVLGDGTRPPIPSRTCDVAVMVGVLEWIAWGRSDGSPIALQQQALEKVWKVLKPGGHLYIGIENRFGFQYFLGAREPHTELRFISLLPRPIGDLYSRLVRRQPYREWVHSKPALEALLYHVGFERVDFWYPLPGYQNFRYLTQYDDSTVDSFVLRRLRTHPRLTEMHYLLGRIGLKLHLHRWASACFSVVARKAHD